MLENDNDTIMLFNSEQINEDNENQEEEYGLFIRDRTVLRKDLK